MKFMHDIRKCTADEPFDLICVTLVSGWAVPCVADLSPQMLMTNTL